MFHIVSVLKMLLFEKKKEVQMVFFASPEAEEPTSKGHRHKVT